MKPECPAATRSPTAADYRQTSHSVNHERTSPCCAAVAWGGSPGAAGFCIASRCYTPGMTSKFGQLSTRCWSLPLGWRKGLRATRLGSGGTRRPQSSTYHSEGNDKRRDRSRLRADTSKLTLLGMGLDLKTGWGPGGCPLMNPHPSLHLNLTRLWSKARSPVEVLDTSLFVHRDRVEPPTDDTVRLFLLTSCDLMSFFRSLKYGDDKMLIQHWSLSTMVASHLFKKDFYPAIKDEAPTRLQTPRIFSLSHSRRKKTDGCYRTSWDVIAVQGIGFGNFWLNKVVITPKYTGSPVWSWVPVSCWTLPQSHLFGIIFICLDFYLQAYPTPHTCWEPLDWNILWLAAHVHTTWSRSLVWSLLIKTRTFKTVSLQYWDIFLVLFFVSFINWFVFYL